MNFNDKIKCIYRCKTQFNENQIEIKTFLSNLSINIHSHKKRSKAPIKLNMMNHNKNKWGWTNTMFRKMSQTADWKQRICITIKIL